MKQRFLVSTVILVLILGAGIMIAGCASQAPASQPVTTVSATTSSGSTGAGQTVHLTLTAQNILFDQKTLTVPAGSTVDMTFVNKDSGVPHNFALYTDSSAKTKLFAGQIVTGVTTVTYTFTAPSSPGNYFFRCDVHPTVMYGTFIVT